MFRAIRKKLFRLVVVSGAGAAATYFFDKDKGEERRSQAKERANSLMGRPSAGGTWQPTAEASANGFDPPVVHTPPSPSPSVVDVAAPPPHGATVTDTVVGPTATPTAPVSGV